MLVSDLIIQNGCGGVQLVGEGDLLCYGIHKVIASAGVYIYDAVKIIFSVLSIIPLPTLLCCFLIERHLMFFLCRLKHTKIVFYTVPGGSVYEPEGEGEREGAVCGHDPSQGQEGRPSLHPKEHYTTTLFL